MGLIFFPSSSPFSVCFFFLVVKTVLQFNDFPDAAFPFFLLCIFVITPAAPACLRSLPQPQPTFPPFSFPLFLFPSFLFFFFGFFFPLSWKRLKFSIVFTWSRSLRNVGIPPLYLLLTLRGSPTDFFFRPKSLVSPSLSFLCSSFCFLFFFFFLRCDRYFNASSRLCSS